MKNMENIVVVIVSFLSVGFCKDKETLYRMREAEIKHSRLAMLAAVGRLT
jgi:hypothetical protein